MRYGNRAPPDSTRIPDLPTAGFWRTSCTAISRHKRHAGEPFIHELSGAYRRKPSVMLTACNSHRKIVARTIRNHFPSDPHILLKQWNTPSYVLLRHRNLRNRHGNNRRKSDLRNYWNVHVCIRSVLALLRTRKWHTTDRARKQTEGSRGRPNQNMCHLQRNPD